MVLLFKHASVSFHVLAPNSGIESVHMCSHHIRPLVLKVHTFRLGAVYVPLVIVLVRSMRSNVARSILEQLGQFQAR
jgi:hypothetical protein